MNTNPAKTKSTIRIFHNMARSGGTMVCKCLGAIQGVRLFSEIHPDAHHVLYMNVTDQAHRWYGLASEADVARKDSFVEGVRNTYYAAAEHGADIVLRDWATIDFIGKVLVEEPTYRFRLDEVLAPHFELKTCSLVRHPLDQWLSTRRLKIYADKLTAEEFSFGYRQYAEAVAGNFVQYEAFTQSPAVTMERICTVLDLPYDAGFIDRWDDNACITGDNKKSSRGSSDDQAGTIRPLSRREVDHALADRLEGNADYQSSLQLLGCSAECPAFQSPAI